MPTPKTAYIEISKQQNLYKHTILKGRWSDWLCTGDIVEFNIKIEFENYY
jgi:hypothetical protein